MVTEAVVVLVDDHSPDDKDIGSLEYGGGAFFVLVDILFVEFLVFGPVDAAVLMVHHVVFLVQRKVHGIEDGGRVDVIVVVIVWINEGMPGIIDGGQQNVRLHEWIKDVHERKEWRDELGAHRESGAKVHTPGHTAKGPVALSLLKETLDAADIESIQKPNVHVAQILAKGVPWVGPRRVDVVAVVVVFVVVVNVGFRKGTRDDPVKEANKVVVDKLEAHVFSVGHREELSVRVCLLVAQDVDVHEIPVHGPDADHVVDRGPPPDESVAGRQRLGLDHRLETEIGRKADRQPDGSVDNERVLGMDDHLLV